MPIPEDRPDLAVIAEWIAPHSTVIDVGCGEGALLAHLAEQKQVDGRGIEIEAVNVSEALARGLHVMQGNADEDLRDYSDEAFDYAVLSIALQMMKDPLMVLSELLRIAKQVAVAIPNFGHWRNRLYLSFKGKMPVTSTLSYAWYNTPNIHFCTLQDFEEFAKLAGGHIEKRSYLRSVTGTPVGHLPVPNLMAERGVYLLRK